VIFFSSICTQSCTGLQAGVSPTTFCIFTWGGTTVPDALVPEIWWPHGSGKGVLGGTEGSGNSADCGGGVGDERWIGSGQGIHSRTRVAITKGRGGKSMARKLQSYKLSCSFIALARTAINQPLSPSFLRAFNIKIQEDLHTTMRDAAMAYPLPAHALAGEVCKVPTANHPNLSIHHI